MPNSLFHNNFSKMKIAILGWGSLIWQPKELKYDQQLGWHEKGPLLPIEFSRISSDGRLTLVIDDRAESKQTFYAVSLFENLDEAILDLAVRESSGRKSIGYYNKEKDEFFSDNFQFKNEIKKWVNNTDCDAVIWTNLSRKFRDKIGLAHNSDSVIRYLETLPEETKVIAEEYIRKAPNQIDTSIRKSIEEKFGWIFIDKKYSKVILHNIKNSMKVKTLIENCDRATRNIESILSLIHVSNKSIHSLQGGFSSDTYQEIAMGFAVIEPVIGKYGNRTINYGANNESIDIFTETLAVYDKERTRIAELCIAELRMLRGKILVMYNNDMEAEIDLS